MPAAPPIDAAEAQRLIDAEKDAGGKLLEWREVWHPRGFVASKHVELAVAVSPEPSEGYLAVTGDWRSPSYIQLRLVLTLGTSGRNLARLCLDPSHLGDVHWHMREHARGSTDIIKVSQPGGKLNEHWLLYEEFVRTMKIVNFATRLPL